MAERIDTENRTCRERCEFKDRNCWMKEDGTWDCSITFEECIEDCRAKS